MFSVRSESAPVPIPSDETVLIVGGRITSNYLEVAMLTLVVYNSLLTLGKEIQYFWRRPISAAGWAFFLNRCAGVITPIMHLICVGSGWMMSLSGMGTILVVDYILLLRVLALYSHKKSLVICLSFLFMTEFAALLGVTLYENYHADFTYGAIEGIITVCGTGNDPAIALDMVLLSLPLVYGCLLMVLAIHKARKLWKETSGLKGSQLLIVLIQDQILYFSMVTFSVAANIIAERVRMSDSAARTLFALGTTSLLCVLGNHLLINLREAVEKGLNEGTSYMPSPASAVNFDRMKSKGGSDSYIMTTIAISSNSSY